MVFKKAAAMDAGKGVGPAGVQYVVAFALAIVSIALAISIAAMPLVALVFKEGALKDTLANVTGVMGAMSTVLISVVSITASLALGGRRSEAAPTLPEGATQTVMTRSTTTISEDPTL